MCHSYILVLTIVLQWRYQYPNFTAEYFTPRFSGEWESIGFDTDGNIAFNTYEERQLIKKTDVDLHIVPYEKHIHSGYIDTTIWIDSRGRQIENKDGVLYADGVVLYDARDNTFENKAAV